MPKTGTMEREVYHVTVNERSKQWQVAREKRKQPESSHATKDEAVTAAKKLAKAADLGQVIIHKENHVIETEHTYGEDPRDVPG